MTLSVRRSAAPRAIVELAADVEQLARLATGVAEVAVGERERA